jgi:hypothetical protein
MRITATLLFIFVCAVQVFAQLPNGSTAPNWTMSDIGPAPNPPTSHTLYNYLDQGYGVIIDFSATWCGPCWNYHNSNSMKNLHNENGPNGTNEAFVFFIEGDAATNEACLYGPAGCVGGTQGNWVAGTPYPIINNHTQNSAYQIAYYPTIYGVCPTNTVQSRKIYLLGQRNKNGLYDFVRGCSTLSVQVDKTDVDCFGNDNGSITIEPVSGVLPISYYWSNGATTQTISNLAPGTYYCDIVDGNGEVETREITVGGPTEALQIALEDIIPENCNGNNGVINIQPYGGNGSYTYFWSNGRNTRNVNQLQSGNYAVTVTDVKGCTETMSFTVDREAAPVAVATPLNEISCNNPIVIISGAGSSEGPNIAYYWSTQDGNFVSGDGTMFPEVDKAGTYNFIVSDELYGCFTSINVTVVGNTTQPAANAGPDLNLPCGGGERSLQGTGDSGQGFVITWTTANGNIVSGANTLNPVVDAPGTYTLTILNNANGCSRTDVMIVGSTGEFSLNAQSAAETCPGAGNGSASVQAVGAQGTVTYSWSNGANTASVNNLLPGEYRVTVTDAGGCSAVRIITIAPGAPATANINKGDESEDGAADGFIELSDGPNRIVSYQWSNGATTSRIEGLVSGTYRVTVTDERGCTAVIVVLVENASCLLAVEIEEQADRICYGSTDGYAKIVLLNDRGEASVSWSDGGQGLEREGLSAGTYEVVVVDDNNCPKTIEITISEFDEIAVNSVRIPVFECAMESDERGILEVIASGGEGGFSYRWSDGQLGNEITVGFGVYTVEVADAEGCISIQSFRTLSSDDEAPVAVGRTDTPSVSIGENGQVEIPAEWLDAGSTDNCAIRSYSIKENPLKCDDLGLTKVTLQVTDTNGNVGETEVEVNVIDDIAPKFDCPRNIRRVSDNPIIRFEDPSATDNCSVMRLEQVEGLASGDNFPYGITQIEYRAVDQSGNVAVCRFTVERVRPGRNVPFEAEECACPKLEQLPFAPGQQAENRSGNANGISSLALYPNPASSLLNFEVSTSSESAMEVRMMNVNGQIVLENRTIVSGTQRIEWNISHLANGLYIAQISVGDCFYTKRVIVQK